MNPPRLIVRQLLYGLAMVLAAARVQADDGPKPDANLEIIQYKAPAGWKSEDRPGETARTLVAADSDVTKQALIMIILSPEREGIDLRAEFDGSIKRMSSDRKVLDPSDVDSVKTRQGFDALAQTLVMQGEGNQRIYMRIVAAKVQNRVAAFCYVATTEAFYDAHQPDMDALLKSVNFNVGAGGAMAGNAAIEALQKERQELLAKLAANEAQLRKLGAAADGAAASAGATRPPNATPAADGDKLLAQAKEQFKRDVKSRRKPHIVLGDILMFDGKPIPNVTTYTVTVWGTTVAAERSQYSLDVDENGHFEQKLPDGVYKVKATCIVKYGGKFVPVDLVWLDDKKAGVGQSSDIGIVRDFRLMMRGLKPDEKPEGDYAYYGGTMKVVGPGYQLSTGSFSQRYPGGKVRVVLTPQGALIDGSQGATITTDVDVTQCDYGTLLRNIPIGAYQGTITLVKKDGSTVALPSNTDGGSTYYNFATVAWENMARDENERNWPILSFTDNVK